MELTQDSLHHLLEDLSSFIQTFLFLLGILLIITPLALTCSHHDLALLSTPTMITPLQRKCHHLYKRFCHYSHMWILVALEELGLFGLLDTLFYWLPISNDGDDNNSNNNNDDDAAAVTTSLLSGSPPHLTGSQRQQSELNHQLANVCIRGPENSRDSSLFVSGLVNTGNTCYLNSVLQALSSLPRLQVYLDGINNQYAHQHLPVTRSLYKTLRLLSRPLDDEMMMNTKHLAFRPVDIISAININHRVINREQQDAHELFQLLSGAIETEGLAATKGSHIDKGLKDLLLPPLASSITTTTTTDHQHNTKLNNPLTGLLANRLSCTTCGYTEAIRHFSFNNIQLTLPQTASTTLYGCLEQLTAMEYLDDVSCRKCSMNGWVQRMGKEVERLQQHVKTLCNDNIEKKRETLSTLVQMERQHRDLVHQLAVGSDSGVGLIHHEHIPYQIHRGQSTKQIMLAKPPKVLCLHISRSTFHPTGVIYKNKCQLEFPEYLDMDRFCTNGTLLTSPDQPISQQNNNNNNNNDFAASSLEQEHTSSGGGVKYKLMSIIVHYGSHSCGHFIAYKRRVVADDCGCDKCGSTSQEDCVLRASDTWYRISDENVDMCTIDEVLLANPYMLLYESVDPPSSLINNNNNRVADGKASSTVARVLVSTDNNNNPVDNDDDDDERLRMPSPITIKKSASTPLSSSSSSSSLSSSSTALSSSSSSSSSTTTLPTSPSPSNSTDLLAVSPSSCANQKHQQHIESNHLVRRKKDRRKLDWQESAPPLVIY